MPDRIRGFQTLIHVSLGLGAVASLLEVGQLDTNADASFVIVVQAATMAALAFFTHLITHHGGHWARWACAILWCVGLPFLMMALMLAYRADALVGGLLAAQALVQGAAIALLFTEDAGNWFEA
ncbi:conserved membrane protein of unknown function [Magnetospirillum sp. XM-1]|uniref:hypothetical protein n=1 Tax=Magnetospirillum sp. XM-1 TaxID=1663591 RepID=UPI00073DDE46|nr:hypothetical protein [Magnetospirillum sp. XM-1]CUW37764.1 conserved membrane protein of unknown function [Magnetospirillum sp. XM-1]